MFLLCCNLNVKFPDSMLQSISAAKHCNKFSITIKHPLSILIYTVDSNTESGNFKLQRGRNIWITGFYCNIKTISFEYNNSDLFELTSMYEKQYNQ